MRNVNAFMKVVMKSHLKDPESGSYYKIHIKG